MKFKDFLLEYDAIGGDTPSQHDPHVNPQSKVFRFSGEEYGYFENNDKNVNYLINNYEEKLHSNDYVVINASELGKIYDKNSGFEQIGDENQRGPDKYIVYDNIYNKRVDLVKIEGQ